MRVASVTAAGLAAVALLGTSSSTVPDLAAGPGGRWAVQPQRSGPGSAWRCVGGFAAPRMVHDSGGAGVVFGARQRCTAAVDQDVEVYLERRIGARWVAVARVGARTRSVAALPVHRSPSCDMATPSAYRLRAYAFAEGRQAAPWPGMSRSYVLRCRIVPF